MNEKIENVVFITLLFGFFALGIITVCSSTFALAISRGVDDTYFLNRQVYGIFIGLGLFLIIQKIDYITLKRLVPLFVILGTLSLLLVFHPSLGICYRGVSRWCRLGPITVQPSEFSRLILIGYFAYYMDKKRIQITRKLRHYLAPVIVWVVMAMLILLEPNYSSFVELGICFLILVFVSGFPTLSFIGVLGVFIGVLVIFIFTSHYRMIRFLAFLDPHLYYKTSGYQVIQSLVSFASGGLWGAGIGAGKQKLFYLPDMYNDYIFAVIGEEMGFLGVFSVATMYLVLFCLCIRISRRSPDLFGALFSIGAGISLTLSAFINMGVCLKLLPPTGLVLPFISYGRSSMVSNIVTMGVVYKISKVSKRKAA